MTSPELETFATELNGGEPVGQTVLFQLLNLARALVEQMRPWMVLRKIDTSKSVTTATTWQTAVSLATITDLNRLYGTKPVKLFDGTNRIDRYRRVPFDQRLESRDASGTFVFSEGTKQLYLNGTVQFAGTLWIPYIANGATITAGSGGTTWQEFPDWAHPLLPFIAVEMHKGTIDYDDVNFAQMGEQGKAAERIMKMLEKWDNELQLGEIEEHDPTERYDDGYRPGAINMHA